MSYTVSELEDELNEKGEIMANMEDDEVFELHIFNTEFYHDDGFVTVEGQHDGEWQERTFDPGNVQDTYIHYEF